MTTDDLQGGSPEDAALEAWLRRVTADVDLISSDSRPWAGIAPHVLALAVNGAISVEEAGHILNDPDAREFLFSEWSAKPPTDQILRSAVTDANNGTVALITELFRPTDSSTAQHLGFRLASMQQTSDRAGRAAESEEVAVNHPDAESRDQVRAGASSAPTSLSSYRERRRPAPIIIRAFDRGRRAAGTDSEPGQSTEWSPQPGLTLIHHDLNDRTLQFVMACTADLAKELQIGIVELGLEAGPETLLFVLGPDRNAESGTIVGSQEVTTRQRDFAETVLQLPVAIADLTDEERLAIRPSVQRSDAEGRANWRAIGRSLPDGDPIREQIRQGLRQ